jgi:ketosteroid isomerase-like protein
MKPTDFQPKPSGSSSSSRGKNKRIGSKSMDMKLTKAQEAEVIETMQMYGTAYQKKDIKTLSALFSPGISGFGSGPDEVISDQTSFIRQMKRDMSQATILSFEFLDRQISGDGRVAWATSKSTIAFTIDGTKKQKLHGRSTMVLRNTGSRWIIEQLHFSLPYGEQSAGQSFPSA